MAIKLKLELKWTEIKRVVTVPYGLSLFDLHNIIQSMFGFEHDHLWNFRDQEGREWNADRDSYGRFLDMNMSDMLDPEKYCIEDVLIERKGKLLYTYDYGDNWRILVSRMADSKNDEIACVKTVGTNALEDIGGIGALLDFTELLQECKIKSEDEATEDTDWRIVEWGYYDPAVRAEFLKGPTLEELTDILRDEVSTAIHEREALVAAAERKKMFKGVGRNEPCPCGSGKKFKKCCGKFM